MRRAQYQTVVLLGGTRCEVLSSLGRLEGERRQKGGSIGIPGRDYLELVEIGEARLDLVISFAQNAVVEQTNPRDVGGDLRLVLDRPRAQPVEQIDQRGVR